MKDLIRSTHCKTEQGQGHNKQGQGHTEQGQGQTKQGQDQTEQGQGHVWLIYKTCSYIYYGLHPFILPLPPTSLPVSTPKHHPP